MPGYVRFSGACNSQHAVGFVGLPQWIDLKKSFKMTCGVSVEFDKKAATWLKTISGMIPLQTSGAIVSTRHPSPFKKVTLLEFSWFQFTSVYLAYHRAWPIYSNVP